MTNPTNQASGVAERYAERAQAEAAYTLAAYNYPRDPVGSRDWTLYYGGWLHRAALANQPAASAEVVASDWRIDNSTPSPILVYKNCSVIQDEQAHWALGVIHDALRAPAQAPSTGAVYLVATGEVVDGQETYTRHEGAPPPLCDFERLYATPPVVQPASPAVEVASEGAMIWLTRDPSTGEVLRADGPPAPAAVTEGASDLDIERCGPVSLAGELRFHHEMQLSSGDYKGSTLCRRTEAALATPHPAVPGGLTAETLYDGIKEALEHYRLSSMVGEDGEPYPLVDALSTPGMSTSTGKDEIVLVCDAIYNEVLRPALAAASTASQPPGAATPKGDGNV